MANVQYQGLFLFSIYFYKFFNIFLALSEYSYNKSGGIGDDNVDNMITSAFDESPSSGMGTSTHDYSFTSSSSPIEKTIIEYQTPDGGVARRVMKTFTTQQTTTKTTRYGSDGSLRTTEITDNRRTSPVPARSSSSMSKLSQVDETSSCKHTHRHQTQKPKSNSRPLTIDDNISPSGEYKLYHMERREETTTHSTQPPVTPTSSRKVKFQDEEFMDREFKEACSSLTKDIDVLPDPELDNGIFIFYLPDIFFDLD